MRVLNFIVDKQIICQDLNCDFSGIVPGTNGYLQANFVFSKEWDQCRKVAIFSFRALEYYMPLTNDTCMIPNNILLYKKFRVSVVGEKDQYKITTNKTEVKQNG